MSDASAPRQSEDYPSPGMHARRTVKRMRVLQRKNSIKQHNTRNKLTCTREEAERRREEGRRKKGL